MSSGKSCKNSGGTIGVDLVDEPLREEAMAARVATSVGRARDLVLEGVGDPPLYDLGKRRLELPVFTREDAYGWIIRVERYIWLNGVREEEKLDAMVLTLEDWVLNWYQWWEEQATNLSQDEFKRVVIQRFQPGLVQNPLGPFVEHQPNRVDHGVQGAV